MKTVKFVAASAFIVAFGLGLADAPVIEAGSDYQSGSAVQSASSPVSAPVHETPTEVESEAVTHLADNSSGVKAPSEATPQQDSPSTIVPQTDSKDLSVEQRIDKVEKQANNIANMNLPQQITLLQQQIAQLHGQLEVQGHDLQLLNKQVRSFYQDLDNRINQLNNLNSGNASSSAKTDNNLLKASTSVKLQDANTYQAAFALLTNRKYAKSIQAFIHYINDYPNGKYVADAHYWLGELYLIQKNNAKAEAEFTTVVSQYPSSAKVSDAKLKIAMIHANTGKRAQAKQELQAIKKQHPDSTAAQLANIRLQQLQQMEEGQ